MAIDEQSINEPLANQKLVAEIEKLHTENRKLQETAWRNPAILIAAGGLFLSLCGNFVQYKSLTASATTSTRQLDLAESKWSEERLKLRAELDALQQKNKHSSVERSSVMQNLEQVNNDISVWDAALLNDNATLLKMNGELSMYESQNRPFMVEATRKNIVLQQNLMKTKSEERAAAVARRTELETRLGNSR